MDVAPASLSINMNNASFTHHGTQHKWKHDNHNPVPSSQPTQTPHLNDLIFLKKGSSRYADPEAAGEEGAHARGEIEKAVRMQEAVGLDILAHGAYDRADMVEVSL